MIQLAPFRALRYNPAAISFISRVVAPPYDLIDEKQAELLHQQDPHNVIRLILGKARKEGRPAEDYQQAACTLASWRSGGILIREPEPAVYLCQQSFAVNGERLVRRGLLSTILLEDLSSGRVLPHEHTTAPAKADRLELMKACRADLSPVFGIFADADGTIDDLLGQMGQGEPLYEFETPDAIAYRVWHVPGGEQVRRLAALLRNEKFVIADGHHRYETALTYREQQRSTTGPAGSAPEDFLLAFCVSSKNEGLKILPTHRLVKAEGQFPRSRFLRIVRPHFNMEQAALDTPEKLRAVVHAWQPGQQIVGCYLRGGRFIQLRPTESATQTLALPDGPEEWRSLPVVMLRHGILDPLFGMARSFYSDPDRLRYEADVEQVYWGVESGQFDAGFLLAPIHPDILAKVTRTGQRMPPKTTYFYPKIPSGLAFYPFDNGGCLPTIVEP